MPKIVFELLFVITIRTKVLLNSDGVLKKSTIVPNCELLINGSFLPNIHGRCLGLLVCGYQSGCNCHGGYGSHRPCYCCCYDHCYSDGNGTFYWIDDVFGPVSLVLVVFGVETKSLFHNVYIEEATLRRPEILFEFCYDCSDSAENDRIGLTGHVLHGSPSRR